MSYEAQVEAAVARLTGEALEAERSLPQVMTVLAHATDACERATARVLELAPPPQPIQCRVGCAWCCLLRVAVTPPEALRLAAWLRAHLSPDELTALTTRLAEAEAQTRDLSWQQHVRLRLPCPLLQDNACSVHPIRPLACRSHNSLDAKCCEEYARIPSERMVPMYKPQQDIANGTARGLMAGLTGAGLEAGATELAAALLLALETPDAGDRWLSGERLF